MLANWFSLELAKGDIDGDTAVQTLVAVLRDDNIGLYPLAAEMVKAQTSRTKGEQEFVRITFEKKV